MINRFQTFSGLGHYSCFLWGPRQVGKTTLLTAQFPKAPTYDLLDPSIYETLQREPAILRDWVLAEPAAKGPIILDEVQKIPRLLDVVQLLIDKHQRQFVLSGSSARKLKRGGGNLLGGRALGYKLFPLTYAELPKFDLMRALNHGLLPRHYLEDSPQELMHAYVGDYLKEEIFAEALTRNLQTFSRFLHAAAFSNGECVNYTNIAQECGVASSTIKDYFEILVDTLIGSFVPSFAKRPKRRVTKAPRFYFFDVGLANFLLQRGKISLGSESFGKAFEHFIYQELLAYSHYSRRRFPISYWRTSSQLEVDFILGDAQVALEVKGSPTLRTQNLKGLKAFQEEYQVGQALVVSLAKRARLLPQGIQVLPWKKFLKMLWAGEII